MTSAAGAMIAARKRADLEPCPTLSQARREQTERNRRHVRSRHVIGQRAELRLGERGVEAGQILIFGKLLAQVLGLPTMTTPALITSSIDCGLPVTFAARTRFIEAGSV